MWWFRTGLIVCSCSCPTFNSGVCGVFPDMRRSLKEFRLLLVLLDPLFQYIYMGLPQKSAAALFKWAPLVFQHN